MRRIFVAFVAVWCAEAQQDIKVTYLTTQASVQDIVKTMAWQAGLGYNWHKSFDQTDPRCRKFVRDVRIDADLFGAAMQQILDPVGLRYAVENGEVVLYRAPTVLTPGESVGTGPSAAPPLADVRGKKLTYSSAKKSVQYVVIDLAKQVGLGYNWDKSLAQTDPECRRFVDHVSIENQPFDKAMAKILNPVGLRYRVESDQVSYTGISPNRRRETVMDGKATYRSRGEAEARTGPIPQLGRCVKMSLRRSSSRVRLPTVWPVTLAE